MFEEKIKDRQKIRDAIARRDQNGSQDTFLLISETLDDYIEQREGSAKVLEGILKDIQFDLSAINIRQEIKGTIADPNIKAEMKDTFSNRKESVMELHEIITEVQDALTEAIVAEQTQKSAEARYQMEKLRDLLVEELGPPAEQVFEQPAEPATSQPAEPATSQPAEPATVPLAETAPGSGIHAPLEKSEGPSGSGVVSPPEKSQNKDGSGVA